MIYFYTKEENEKGKRGGVWLFKELNIPYKEKC